MAKQTVIITGDKELDDFMRAFVPKLQKKAIRKGTRESAKVVLQDMKSSSPVVTGKLAKNLKVRALKRSRSSQGHSVAALMHKNEAYYAIMLEFGTRLRLHKSGKDVGEIEPGKHAFMRPALYDNKQRVKKLFTKVLWDGMKAIAAKEKVNV